MGAEHFVTACVAEPHTLRLLMFSDGIGGRLKALASTKLKVETANRQSSNRVRTAHTLHVGFEVPRDSSVGCVA